MSTYSKVCECVYAVNKANKHCLLNFLVSLADAELRHQKALETISQLKEDSRHAR